MSQRIAKKKTTSTRNKRKPQENRKAREGWSLPHTYGGKMFPPVDRPGDWMSPQETAAALGLTLKTVRKYAAAGVLSSKRHGYFRLISRADVLKFRAKS